MGKTFLLLDDNIRGFKFGVYLERTECGVVGIVNFHFSLKGVFEILLTDSKGENFHAKMLENPFIFSLPMNFDVDERVLVDIFFEDELIASGETKQDVVKNESKNSLAVENWLKNEPKITEDYLAEAREFISKAKDLYGEGKIPKQEEKTTSFYNKIGADFDLLYNEGRDDFLLCKKFKNSIWRRVEIEGEIYILGKIYAGKSVVGEGLPAFVALAIPTTFEGAKQSEPLGKNAKFYHANIYDSFGFLVLVQNAITGKAVAL